MALDQTALALLVLFGTAALKVFYLHTIKLVLSGDRFNQNPWEEARVGAYCSCIYGCVCYVGQEPNQTTGKRYGWSLAEQRPCECTEFRLGGVNMKPQIKPYEVKIGEGNRVSINEQGQIIQSPDCRKDPSGTTFEGTSLCAQNTHEFVDTMELQLPMTSPMRLEFIVNTGGHVGVNFSPNVPGIHGSLYYVDLGDGYGRFYKQEDSSQVFTLVQENGVTYIGVPVIITYDNGHFEVAIQGVQDSTLTYDVPSPPQPSWFVSFTACDVAEVVFTEPCINYFDPKFTP